MSLFLYHIRKERALYRYVSLCYSAASLFGECAKTYQIPIWPNIFIGQSPNRPFQERLII